uniref:Protein kinase domain-containing protein n=1 Tax=Globisporangium ultimum (strain ATCC 200006 / CBS 805.95 / DAOM BR144) TaxID=431595 RepID=K3X9K0_GLOUD
MQADSESHVLTLVSITLRLCNFLLKYKSKTKNDPSSRRFPGLAISNTIPDLYSDPLKRFIASRTISNSIRHFHEEIDHFTAFGGYESVSSRQLTWQEQWSKDRLNQQEILQDLLSDDDALTRGFVYSDEGPEGLFHLQYELQTCEAEGDTGMCARIQSIMDRLAAKLKMAPPVVPEWFVSSDDVDFYQWNRVDRDFIKEDFPKYHGMWNKASVMIATSPLKPRDFELHATNWFSLRHPNVISLYGACHVSSPLIFVYEFDPSEITLREFLWRKENRHLTWEKLYEAALGVRHMHQRQVVHGYLGDENIVISQGGRAKVGGLQIHNATGTPFKSPEEMWSGVIASLSSDIFAFGTCIMNAAASDNFELYKANQGFLSGEIPACVSGLSKEQWDLVVKMCAYEPQARVDIAYVVGQLKKFAMERPTRKYRRLQISRNDRHHKSRT